MKILLRFLVLLLAWASSAQAATTPRNQTAQLIQNTGGTAITTLALPLVVTAASTAATSFQITNDLPLPTAAQGVLKVNGTTVTTTPFTVSLANASTISFTPAAAFTGTYLFSYRSVDGGGASAAFAYYAIPVAQSACAVGDNLNFLSRAANEDWSGATGPTVTVNGVDVKSGFVATGSTKIAPGTGVTAASQVKLDIEDNANQPGKALVWSAFYGNATNTSVLTFSFFKAGTATPVALSNFAIDLGDVDNSTGQWRDELTLTGTKADGSIVQVAAGEVALGSTGTNAYATGTAGATSTVISGVAGTANATDSRANLIVNFSQPIVSLKLSYRNPATAAFSLQVVTIPSMSWCAAADVATTITPTPSGSVLAGAALKFDVTYTNAGPGQAPGYTQTLQLTAGLGASNVTFTNLPTGVTASYADGTGVVTFAGSPTTLASGANQNLTVNILVVPASLASITANSTVGTSSGQGPDTGANSATSTVTVTPAPDLATTIGGPATAVAGQTIRYTATTTNSGTVDAAGTQTTITLPSKPATVVTNGSYNPITGVVTFTNGTLAVGATVVNTVEFVASGTSVSGTAASTTTTPEGNLANNSDNVTTTVAPTGAAGTVAPCATAGKDGSLTLSTNSNAYYPSIAAQTRTVGATTIQVGAARGAATSIAPGDLLLIIQMQGADIDATNTDSYGDGIAGGPAYGSSVTTNFTAGTYEYVAVAAGSATVTAAAGGTITLATGLKNGYVNAVATATTGQRTFQVIRVPQYSTLTLGANIVPTAWNGSTGGIVALDVAGQLNLAGYSIDASGLGFRGGAGRQLNGDNTGTTGTDYRSSAAQNAHATKGEGLAGTPRYLNDNNTLLDTRTSPFALPAASNDGYPSGDNGRGAPGNAGGGGTDSHPTANDENSGGGGGANGGRGGRGGNAWNSASPVGGEPGAAFPAATSSRLVLGGGGGAGTTNNGTGTPGAGFASSGAAGGGMVLVRVGTVAGVGSILANGADANNSVLNDGSGGGGAGGSILVTATNSQAGLANLTLTANGGKGGTNTGGGALHGPGGGGGGGIVFTNGAVAVASMASGAANGTTTASNSAFGAEAGVVGVANPAISNSVANSVAGSSCIADVAATITGPSTANAASTVTLSVTFVNNGAQPAANTTRVVTFPANTLAVAPTATGGTVTGTATTGFTVTYPALNPSAPNTPATFSISYVAPATGPVTATATTTTTTGEGGLTANNTSSVSTFIGLIADVTTALTGPTSVTPGQPTGNYTVTYTNEGPSTALNTSQQVTLPAGATNVLVNGNPFTPTGNVINFGTYTMNAGTSTSYTFSFTPAAGATGSQAITSNVATGTSQGANSAPDAATLNVTVAPTADVTAAITATTPSVVAGTLASAGTAATFTATFSNNGPATAAGVVATVQLPKGLTNVTATNGGVYSAVTGLVTYAGLTSIANGTPTTSVIKFDAPATGPVVATASISTTSSELGQTANNQATAAMTVTTGFDLTTTLTGPASAVVGDLVTLAVTTTNNGPGSAANAVQTVQLVSGLTNVYVSNGGVYNSTAAPLTIVSNGVTYTNVPAGGVVFPTLPNLPNGQTVPNSVSYSQPATAFAPSALVTPNTTGAGDSNTANNTAFLNGAATATTLTNATPTGGIANAYTRISSSVASTTVGGAVTLTVVTGNNGPAQATGVTQTVQLLPGLATAGLLVNGSGTTTTAGNVVTFTDPAANGAKYDNLTGILTFGTLTNGTNGSTSGTSVSNTVTFNAPATVGSNGQLLAMAAVSTTNTDPVPADNVSLVAVTLLQRTDLATTITGPSTATAGQSVQYTATFTNNGPMGATGVVATAQLPAGLGAGTVTVTDGAGTTVTATYNSTTGQLTLPATATQAAGAAQVFRITFTATGSDMTVSSNVSSTSSDVVAANNSASTMTNVIGVADLATTVSGPATAAVGNPVTYTVLTNNLGTTPATNAATTLLLATGFTPATLQVNGQTGPPVGGDVTFADGSFYDASTGIITFPAVANFAIGASTANYVTFLMPGNPTNGAITGQIAGTSSVSSDASDPVVKNNSSGIATSIAPATTTTADLTALVTASAASVPAGGSVTFTATFGNATGSAAAINVRPTLQLQPGLAVADIQEATSPTAPASGTLANGIITFPNGATYSQATGVVSFPLIASQAAGAGGNVVYSVKVNAPTTGSLTAVAVTTSDTSEPNTVAAQTNNVSTVPVSITPTFDVVTALAGPVSAVVGSSQTYTVTTTNNGPQPTGSITTQTVTVPAGQTPTNITNGGVYSNASNTITWTIPAGQAAGTNGAVANSFTITQTAGGASLTATVSAPGESNIGNDVAYLNGALTLTATTVANQPPLAYAVVNSRQSATGTTNNPMGNTVANNPATPNGLLISPLVATDPENALGATPYTITSLPTLAQGVLYYDNGGTYAAVTVGKTLTAAQATTLRFLPNTAFTGNASFTYLSTDAVGNTSPGVEYTIPVAGDQPTTYTKYNSTKGLATNKYLTNDILAQTIDPNTAQYTSAGLVYDATTGALLSGAANGLPTSGTNATLVSGTLPTGVSLDPATGRIYVSNAALLPQSGIPQNFTVTIRTTDINGGTNNVPVTFTLGAYPLPVELTAFAAAAKNLDALLTWNTASEKSNDHFDVERSLNGTDFVKIDEVRGQGTSSSATDYARTDVGIGAKANGLVYYRLKQVDTDGTSSYSPVRTVRFGKVVPAIALFPNPATAATSLDLTALPAGSYQVSVLDATGRTVLFTTLDAGLAHTLQLNTIASGTYTLLVRGTNGGQVVNLTKRLIKE